MTQENTLFAFPNGDIVEYTTPILVLDGDILTITLPSGCDNTQLLYLAKYELDKVTDSFFGKDVKVTGRCTTHLAAWLGHALAHITKSVSFFDPKENQFVLVIKH